MQDVFAYIDANRDRYLAMLQRLVRQRSVAAQNIGMVETARMVEELLAAQGFAVQQYPTGGHPVVYAERPGSSGKRLSFYNHYDVQPADPLDLWTGDAWSGEIRDGRIWGRGVADNKGNLAARIAAMEAVLAVRGDLPLGVKFIVEGEEEIGSVHLTDFTEAHPDLCAADACIWEFGGTDWEGRPLLHLGLKGICYVELRAHGANTDLHSALATSVPNPAWRLTWALATLKGPDERVLIPGFYDRVRQPSAADIAAVERLPDEAGRRLQHLGIASHLLGLDGTALKARDCFEPTCTISGLLSGYTEAGSKTVLPARAMAKIDMRLVPDQDPHEIFALLRSHLDANGFTDIEAELLGPGYPARTPIDAPIARVVAETHAELTGKEAVLVPTSAGSGPWRQVCGVYGIDACTAGVGHPGSNAHAPDENIFVEDYIQGIKHIAMIMDRFAQV